MFSALPRKLLRSKIHYMAQFSLRMRSSPSLGMPTLLELKCTLTVLEFGTSLRKLGHLSRSCATHLIRLACASAKD